MHNEMNVIIDDNVISEALNTLELPFGASNPALMAYHRLFVHRYANTISCLTQLPQNSKVLEMAAGPYGMTAILRKFLFEDIELATFGRHGEITTIRLELGKEQYCFKETRFNAEVDRWPYEDESFDLILCCEMLEHLAMDPMNVFAEANRVLRTDGHLFVSTPNASSLQNAIKCLAFRAQSLAPHYRSPMNLEGLYQRHNRELTPPALHEMFSAAGFKKEVFTTTNSYHLDPCELDPTAIHILRSIFGTDMRDDTMNYLGRKIMPVMTRYPTSEDLYLASDHPKAN